MSDTIIDEGVEDMMGEGEGKMFWDQHMTSLRETITSIPQGSSYLPRKSHMSQLRRIISQPSININKRDQDDELPIQQTLLDVGKFRKITETTEKSPRASRKMPEIYEKSPRPPRKAPEGTEKSPRPPRKFSGRVEKDQLDALCKTNAFI